MTSGQDPFAATKVALIPGTPRGSYVFPRAPGGSRRSEGAAYLWEALMQHPCESSYHAQVPVSVVQVTIVWCHGCARWVVMTSAHTQNGEEDVVELEKFERHEFGPFDETEYVCSSAEIALGRLMLTPGRPWDQGSWG